MNDLTLSKSIESDDVISFNRLLSTATINEINQGSISNFKPLNYALNSKNDYFIKELIKNEHLDIYFQVNKNNLDLNPIEEILDAFSYKDWYSKQQNGLLENVKLFLVHLNQKIDFDEKRFFNDNFFTKIFEHEDNYELLINNLPTTILKRLLNYKPVDKDQPPLIALRLLHKLKTSMKSIKKLMSLLTVNEDIQSGNTVLHYYISTDYDITTKIWPFNSEKVIIYLLECGFDINQKNNAGIAMITHPKLLEMKKVKEHLITTEYNNLQKNLKNEIKAKERKSKI